MNHGTASAYRNGCRCEPCRDYNRATIKNWRRINGYRNDTRGLPGLPDDGIIDEIAVERLAAGTLTWDGATLSERREAARRMFAAGRGYEEVFQATHLRSQLMREVRAS